MDPLTIAVGTMAVSSLAQLIQSEMARGASRKELKKIEDLYNKIKPPDYDLSVMDPPELHAEALARPEFSDPVQAPKFDLSKLRPEDYEVIGKLDPKIASYIQEAAPQTVKKTEDMRLGREAQRNALRRFTDIGEGGFDPEYQEAVTRASRSAQADAQSRQQSLLQDFARRGQLGSGSQLAAQIGAGSQAMNNQAMTNLSAATQGYRNRLDALARGAELGGQIGQQDMNLQKTNADIINDFNQRLTATRQTWENNRVNALNAAQLRNLDAEQQAANMNVGARNQANEADRARLDALAKYGYEADVRQQGRQDDLSKWNYGADVDQRGYQNQISQQNYANKIAERNRIDRLKAQGYDDEVARAGLKAGVATQRSALGQQQAQDYNQVLQGAANIGGTYAASQAGQQASAQRFSNDKELQRLQALANASTKEDEARIKRAYG